MSSGFVRCAYGQVLAGRESCDDAMRAFGEAVASFTKLGSRLKLGCPLYRRASTQFARGDTAKARADMTRSRDMFAAMGAARGRARAEALLTR